LIEVKAHELAHAVVEELALEKEPTE